MKGAIFTMMAMAAMSSLAISPVDKARINAKVQKAAMEQKRREAGAALKMQRKVQEHKVESAKREFVARQQVDKARFKMEQKKMAMRHDWARRFPHGPADFHGWRRGKIVHPTYRRVWVGDVWYDAYGYPCYSPTYVIPTGVAVVPMTTVVAPAPTVVTPAPVVVTPAPTVVVPVVR